MIIMKKYRLMNKPILTLAVLAAITIFWHSCSQNEQKGTLQFGLEFTEDTKLKSSLADPDVTAALVSIISETGEVIINKEPLPIYKFGDQYTTRNLTLPVGHYLLTEFMLIDTSGVVLWATPVEGSPLAHLVTHPLPVPFGISPEQTTSLEVEVIRVKEHPPADFGYVQFPIGFVERFCLRVLYSSRSVEVGKDTILGPDGSYIPIPDENGSYMPIPQTMLTVYTGNRQVLCAPLIPGLNDYILPLVDDWYTLVATDFQGHQFYKEQFPLRELIKHRCGENTPPLVIYHAGDTGIIITPEGLSEPTIGQGVFGTVTVPADDTTVTGQYDVRPVIRDIYFYPYTVMDSIWRTFAPIDCYFPIEMLNIQPVAIVRSNSDGFFQIPLKEGEYLYLVKTEHGFYYDAWVSSHLPGKVTVFPGEVTQLMIHVIDCSMWM